MFVTHKLQESLVGGTRGQWFWKIIENFIWQDVGQSRGRPWDSPIGYGVCCGLRKRRIYSRHQDAGLQECDYNRTVTVREWALCERESSILVSVFSIEEIMCVWHCLPESSRADSG